MSLTPNERETVITTTDGDELVRIWSAQRRHIGRMRRDAAFTEVATGTHEDTEWAEFTIPADQWSPAGVKRSRNLTAEQRELAAERLRVTKLGLSSPPENGPATVSG